MEVKLEINLRPLYTTNLPLFWLNSYMTKHVNIILRIVIQQFQKDID